MPYLEFFALEEVMNWNLPIQNKRPIFESIAPAGVINIGSKFASGAQMRLQINKVTLNDDPLGFSESKFTYLGFVDKFEQHKFDLTNTIGIPG